jgi:hypothetical protein
MPVNPFKWKHYEGEIILLNVRMWQCVLISVNKEILIGLCLENPTA